MTPADLDKIEAAVAQCPEETRAQWLDLLRLARRGLRVEEETCGRCEHWRGDVPEESYCDLEQVQPGAGDYCSRWRAKEER